MEEEKEGAVKNKSQKIERTEEKGGSSESNNVQTRTPKMGEGKWRSDVNLNSS